MGHQKQAYTEYVMGHQKQAYTEYVMGHQKQAYTEDMESPQGSQHVSYCYSIASHPIRNILCLTTRKY